MKAQTYLHIPTPCHEDWDKMTPNQQGRHCESCCKTVVDFQMMTDQQVLNFFAKANGNTCGRFSDDQLNRPLEETVVQKKKGLHWLMASFASLFFFVTRNQAQTLQGKVACKPQPSNLKQQVVKRTKAVKFKSSKGSVAKIVYDEPKAIVGDIQIVPIETKHEADKIDVQIFKGDTVIVNNKKSQLSGSVTDEKGSPIAGVTVSSITKRGNLMFATNEIGEFFINNPIQLNEEIELKFSSLGYEEKSVPVTFDESKLELHIQLKEKPKQLDEVVVVSYPVTRCTSITGGAVSRVRVQQIRTMDTISTIIKKVFKSEGFKIFPNPASKGKAVNLTINEAGDYSIQLLDNSSRLLHVEDAIIKGKKEVKLFNIPSTISSGMYYIRLVDEKSKKQYVDKLLVQ